MKPNHQISGAHLFLVANAAGGSSKTTFAAEAKVACTMRGIPSSLVTFDGQDQTLNKIFRGSGVHQVAKPSGEALLDSFGTHIDAARDAGEVIIADTPSCINDPDCPLMMALSDSKILEKFDSIGLLIPVTATHHHLDGAFEALAALQAAGIKCDRGLIRAWRDPELKWDHFRTFDSLKALYPVWDCGTYMQSMTDMMWGYGNFAEYPALDKLQTLFAENGQGMTMRKRGQLRAAVAHLERATDAIYERLLAPIIEKPSKSGKSE